MHTLAEETGSVTIDSVEETRDHVQWQEGCRITDVVVGRNSHDNSSIA